MIAVHVEGNPWLILFTPGHTTDGLMGRGRLKAQLTPAWILAAFVHSLRCEKHFPYPPLLFCILPSNHI